MDLSGWLVITAVVLIAVVYAYRSRKQAGDDDQETNQYAEEQGQQIQSETDATFLRQGLAACSIAGLRIDYRDLLVCLGYLYCKADDAGIDPKPYFKEVAELSDTETSALRLSTADLIRDFHETAYFKELRERSAG